MTRMTRWAAVVFTGVWALLAAQGAETAPVTAVLQADAARCAAMMKGDGAALAALLSEELRFVHSDGRIELKGDYVKNLMAGDTEYREGEPAKR